MLHDLFSSGGEPTVQALEQAELICIVSTNGRPSSIKAGKPVYQAAFESLVKDDVLRARLDVAILSQLIGMENKTIDKYENELKTLAGLPNMGGNAMQSRIRWLIGKIRGAQDRVEKYEAQSGKLKKVLTVKF